MVPWKKKRGRVWHMFWKDNSVKHSKSLGTRDSVQAELKMGEEFKRMMAGETDSHVTGIRWDAFKKEFLKPYKGKTLRTFLWSFGHFEAICRPILMDRLSYRDAKQFKSGLMEYHRKFKTPGRPPEPMKDNSINIAIRNLHTAFAEAVRMRYVRTNIFDTVEQINVTKRVPRYLSEVEVQKAKRIALEAKHPDVYLMVLFLLHTGMRKTELLNLKWNSIDLDRGVLFLHGSETWDPKDREEHAIGLHPDLVKGLKSRARKSDYIFPGRSGGVRDKDAVGRLFNNYLQKAGTKFSGVHILRHTFATHFPGPAWALQRILGHSDPRTTQRYRHVTQEELLAVRQMNYGAK